MSMNFAHRIKNILFPTDEPYFMRHNKRYSAYEIGEGTYGYPEIVFYDAGAKLKIGRYTQIAPKVTILLGGEHHHDWVSAYPFSLLIDEAKDLPGYPFHKGDVVIGNDVWIGYDALILSGVKIGDGAVIAARSLVTKDVEPFSIVGGIPAKHLRFRFSADLIKSLSEIAWWNWSEEEVSRARHLIQSPNIEEFIQKYSTGK